MDDADALARLSAARVAVLATVRPEGGPHLVPVTFASLGNRLVSAIDHKPKRTGRLQRLENIRADPRVSLLVHGYDDTWSRLWWVRADGSAAIIDRGVDFEAARAALVEKYVHYRSRSPAGPVIEIAVERVVGWESSPGEAIGT